MSDDNEMLDLIDELKQFDDALATDDGLEPGVHVTVSGGKMSAFLHIVRDDSGAACAVGDAMKKLASAGVRFGVNEAAVRKICEEAALKKSASGLAAEGKPKIDGKDAWIEHLFKNKENDGLSEDEKANVDHRERTTLVQVEEGELLAVKHDAVRGSSGTNVLGERLPAKEGMDVPFEAGESVQLIEDGKQAVAKAAGHPFVANAAVHVSQIYDVRGDVDYSRGNIDFDGTVLVRGNVLPGFTVKAKVAVEIEGNVDNGTVRAGKNVRVRGGFYGKNGGEIFAGADVHIRSVENGKIEAGGDIRVSQSVRHSVLMAAGSVHVPDLRGGIVGGSTLAAKSVEAVNIGSNAFTATEVEIGISPKVKAIYDNLTSSVKEYEMQLEKVESGYKKLAALKDQNKLPADKIETLAKLGQAVHSIGRTLEVEKSKLNFLEEKLQTMKKGRIRASGTIHPKVRAKIGIARMEVKTELHNCELYEDDGQIKTRPY